jgi:hypothetical protein
LSEVGSANITEQFKGLTLQNQQYASVPSQITGNKENSKKSAIEAANTSKVALKAREFGREITNATASSSNAGGVSNKQNHSVIIEPTQTSAITASSAQNSSMIVPSTSQGSTTGGNSREIKTGAHSTKMVSKNIILNFNEYLRLL